MPPRMLLRNVIQAHFPAKFTSIFLLILDLLAHQGRLIVRMKTLKTNGDSFSLLQLIVLIDRMGTQQNRHYPSSYTIVKRSCLF